MRLRTRGPRAARTERPRTQRRPSPCVETVPADHCDLEPAVLAIRAREILETTRQLGSELGPAWALTTSRATALVVELVAYQHQIELVARRDHTPSALSAAQDARRCINEAQIHLLELMADRSLT